MITVSVVQKALRDVLQHVFEQAFSSSAVMQNLYFLDVFVNVDTNGVTLDICKHNNNEKINHQTLCRP